MNEQPERLDRELKAMLSANPSPDFQARIRARAFSTPPKTPWFAWISSLAAATAAVLLIVIYSGPKPSEVRPSPPAIAETREVPQPPVVIETPRQVLLSRPSRREIKTRTEPSAVLVPAPAAAVALPPAEIRLPALKALELTDWIQPIPQEPFSIAGLHPINIEPPTLTVPNLE